MIKRNLLLLLCMGMASMGTHTIEQESVVVEQESEVVEQKNAPYEHILKYVPSRYYIPAAIIAFVGKKYSWKASIKLCERFPNGILKISSNTGEYKALNIVKNAWRKEVLVSAVALGYAFEHKKYAYVPGLLAYFSIITDIIPGSDTTKLYVGTALLCAGYLYDCHHNDHDKQKADFSAIKIN